MRVNLSFVFKRNGVDGEKKKRVRCDAANNRWSGCCVQAIIRIRSVQMSSDEVAAARDLSEFVASNAPWQRTSAGIRSLLVLQSSEMGMGYVERGSNNAANRKKYTMACSKRTRTFREIMHSAATWSKLWALGRAHSA